MKMVWSAVAVGLVGMGLVVGGGVRPVAAAGRLDMVLAKMDKASAGFKSAEASFHKELYDHVVKDTTQQVGSLYVLRTGGQTQMGLKITGEGATTVEFKGQMVRKYQPGLKCYEQYDMTGKGNVDTFLALGFGGSGAELKKTWTITDGGTEQMSDGTKMVTVDKLELVGKDESVRKNFSKVILWMDADRGISLKQEFDQPDGDKQTAYYKDIKVNAAKVNTDAYKITGNACGK